MSALRIRLFGAFRAYGGELQIEVPSPLSAREVKAAIAERIAALPNGERGRALVGESALADETRILSDEDSVRSGQVLAILPPVCGG